MERLKELLELTEQVNNKFEKNKTREQLKEICEAICQATNKLALTLPQYGDIIYFTSGAEDRIDNPEKFSGAGFYRIVDSLGVGFIIESKFYVKSNNVKIILSGLVKRIDQLIKDYKTLDKELDLINSLHEVIKQAK